MQVQAPRTNEPSVDALVPVLSYARISTDAARDRHGVTDQHGVNRRTAAGLGWTVVAEITDNDRPASRVDDEREGFERALRVLAAGRLEDGTPVGGVVVVAEDRLARRAGDYERFVDALTVEQGRVFADARGPRDLYAEDVEGLGLVGVAFAKIETRKMARRMRANHRARAERGVPPSGARRPFGWCEDRRTEHPVEGPLMRQAVTDFVGGRSIGSIVLQWQREGVTTATGAAWRSDTLRSAIENPRLCGWRRIRGEIVRDASGQPVVGCWDALVTPEQWQAAEAIRAGRRGRRVDNDGRPGELLPADHRAHRCLLSGILRCGKCGTRLRISVDHRIGRSVYLCPSKSAGGCAGVSRRADKVDEHVSALMLAVLRREAGSRADAKSGGKPWPGEDELTAVQGKLGRLRAQWIGERIGDEVFFPTAHELEERLRKLRAEQSRHALTAERADRDYAKLAERWELPAEQGGYDLTERRALIRENFHAIIVKPSGKGRHNERFNADLLVPLPRGD
jgi:DNA invertase Pin-like site-specific DNA recombinase